AGGALLPADPRLLRRVDRAGRLCRRRSGRRRARPERHQRRAVGRPAGVAGHLRPGGRQAHLPHLPARSVPAAFSAHRRSGERHGLGRTTARDRRRRADAGIGGAPRPAVGGAAAAAGPGHHAAADRSGRAGRGRSAGHARLDRRPPRAIVLPARPPDRCPRSRLPRRRLWRRRRGHAAPLRRGTGPVARSRSEGARRPRDPARRIAVTPEAISPPPPQAAAGGGHRLSPLLTPQSIALVGASPKYETVGNGMIRGVREGQFGGRLYLVNPNYTEIDGLPCYPSLAELPEAVDHVVIGVANARIEAQLAEAIRHGARAATIFASCYLPDDGDPPLTKRIAAMARAAGLQICGGNGMGFYNLEYGLRVCGFPPPAWLEQGNIALISHSGSAFSGLCHTDRRFRFSLAVSAGQELTTTVADYLDFALDMPSTRVVGLFLETVRDPAGFVAALEKARQRDI